MQKHIKHIASILLVFISLILCSLSYAKAILNIVPTSTTARTLHLAANGSATLIYTVTNNVRVNVDHLVIDPYYNIPGTPLTLAVQNNLCTGTLTPGGSCTFQLAIQSKTPATTVLEPRVCTFSGATCSVPVLADRMTIATGGVARSVAYIANSSPNGPISICPVNADGSLGSCIAATDTSFNIPNGMVVNSKATILYVTNFGNNTLSLCPINQNGSLGTCTVSPGGGTFDSPDGVALNPAGTIMYVSNLSTPTVSICQILSDGSIGSCGTSNGNGTFDGMQSITLNADGTYAYICNFTNVSICPIMPNGTFGTCVLADGNGTFNEPEGVSFSPDNTTAYVGNFGNNTISLCPILQDGSGHFGTCVVSGGNGTFDFSADEVVGLFMASPSHIGYIPNNGNNTVSICPVNGTTLGTCAVNTDSTYNSPTFMTLSYAIT
jgi:DNA-binding beta-propeller fold protein YncE